MKRVIIFGEAMTYPPKEGIAAHLFSTLTELAKLTDVQPLLVTADRGFFDAVILDTMPWETILVPPDSFYDLTAMEMLVASLRPDILQSYNVYQARLIGMPLATKLRVPFVFEHHDLETELSSFLGLPKALAADNQGYQQDILRFASLNRVMSRYDYDALVATYQNDHTVLKTLAWLPVSQTDAFGCSRPKPASNNGVLFIGNGSYPPNAQAIEYILGIIAPANPKLHFHIIGRDTDRLCRDYPGNNVTGYGQVDDLAVITQQCFVGIIPISAGSGMKVKILTYLSAGLPVIGSSIAFHGYNDPAVLLSAETKEEYAQHFSFLLTNGTWQAYGTQARKLFTDCFDATIIAGKLAQQYNQLPLHISSSDRIKLPPIARNDSRLAWIHEMRDTPFGVTDQIMYKGKRH